MFEAFTIIEFTINPGNIKLPVLFNENPTEMKLDVINKINLVLSQNFNDYTGIYFFGSRTTETYSESSDYDVVLVFKNLDYEKQMEVAGLMARIEYEEKVTIDYKVLTSRGKRSIAHIRSKVNPTFIQQAIDNGYYFGRV